MVCISETHMYVWKNRGQECQNILESIFKFLNVSSVAINMTAKGPICEKIVNQKNILLD